MRVLTYRAFGLFVVIWLVACGGEATTQDLTVASASELKVEPPLFVGGDRPARVVLPEDYDIEQTYPILFMLHGYSANPALQDLLFQLERRVDEHQFILVLPAGTINDNNLRFWNATPECCDFDQSGVDDVAYLTGLIDESLSLYAVDPTRVGFLGHSNGGYMSYRLACEIPHRISAVAVLAGSVFLDEADCTGQEPVSVLHMHGTEDDVVPYENNVGTDFGDAFRVETVGAEEAVERWALKAGCSPEQPIPTTANLHTGLVGEETDVLQWTGCTEGIAVELWRINGGDHLVLEVNDVFRDGIVEFLTR